MTQIEYEKEVDLLIKAADLYYRGEDSGMTDAEFDQRIEALRQVEMRPDIVVRKDSPTRNVNGGSPTFKEKHDLPMLSLADIFSYEDLQEWVQKKSQGADTFVVEPKIDGLSVEFWYDGGKLVKALTRGDGITGEDVTEAAKGIPRLPKEVPLDYLVVRGEVYMAKEAFLRYQKEVGPAANARNLAVGIMRRKDDFAGSKYLDVFMFRVHSISVDSDMLCQSQYSTMAYLRSLGFNTVSDICCQSWTEVQAAVNHIHELRQELECDIDGAVIKVDSFANQESLGDNGHVPHWAVAYKYPPEEQVTQIEDIQFQMGKTGKLTPVAILKPVKVAGSTISKATLHNQIRMERLDIRVGDRVWIHKAGDIIPAISRAEHTEDSKDFYYPTKCPFCNQPVIDQTCINPSCPKKAEFKIVHWASKSGVDIEGVSKGLISTLIDRRVIKSIPDIYRLDYWKLIGVPKLGDKKIKKILISIKASTNASFERFLNGLGITGLGGVAAKKLAEETKTWNRLCSLTLSEVADLIGEAKAITVYREFHSPAIQAMVGELHELNIFRY